MKIFDLLLANIRAILTPEEIVIFCAALLGVEPEILKAWLARREAHCE